MAGASKLFYDTKLYPYSERDNPKQNRVFQSSGKYINTVEPDGLKYWSLLAETIQRNPVEERDRFFMAMLKPLGIEKGKAFAPDERQRGILEEAARVGHAMAQVISFSPRIPEAEAYPGTHWMHTFTFNTNEGTQQRAEHYEQLDERLHYLFLGT